MRVNLDAIIAHVHLLAAAVMVAFAWGPQWALIPLGIGMFLAVV